MEKDVKLLIIVKVLTQTDVQFVTMNMKMSMEYVLPAQTAKPLFAEEILPITL